MSIGPFSTQTINIPFFRQKKFEIFQTISAIYENLRIFQSEKAQNIWKVWKVKKLPFQKWENGETTRI